MSVEPGKEPSGLVRTGKYGLQAEVGRPAAHAVIDSIADLPGIMRKVLRNEYELP